jgi:signal transduction histidine kinase
VMCSVEDSGVGIPEESQKDVFKFLVTSKSTGMGLGLWLSKYIVERNKGEISVGSSELGGAIFSIKFPIANP